MSKDSLQYRLIYDKRETVEIKVLINGDIMVKAPDGLSIKKIDEIVEKKSTWITKKRNELLQAQEEYLSCVPSEEFRMQIMEKSFDIISERVKYFQSIMNVEYKRFVVKNQKKRWGSCNNRGEICYNWKCVALPKPVLDYIIVHELSHLLELNHSSAFYQCIENVLPDYKDSMAWLKKYGSFFLESL